MVWGLSLYFGTDKRSEMMLANGKEDQSNCTLQMC